MTFSRPPERRDESSRGSSSIDFDQSAPVLVVKIGPYHYRPSALGIVRSLGSVGVPVHVIRSGSLNPDAVSRYAVGDQLWVTTGFEEPETLAQGLAECARDIGQKPIVICTDDESAILVAEHARELAACLTSTTIASALPRMLASKQSLIKVAHDHGVLTPDAVSPKTWDEIEDYARHSPFPIVAKNSDPFSRLTRPAVGSSRRIDSKEELLSLATTWEEPFGVVLQEYIPQSTAEDWFTHAYAASYGDEVIVFTGRKLRSWPPYSGITATGRAQPNDELAQIATRFLKDLNYRGPADLDWRRDLRDGGYRLLDFNPRIGGQFRIFQSAEGIDIARLLHLELTHRPLPSVKQIDGRCYVDDFFLLPSAYGIWKQSGRRRTTERPHDANATRPTLLSRKQRLVFAWFAIDDARPFFHIVLRLGRSFTVSRVHRRRERMRALDRQPKRPHGRQPESERFQSVI